MHFIICLAQHFARLFAFGPVKKYKTVHRVNNTIIGTLPAINNVIKTSV